MRRLLILVSLAWIAALAPTLTAQRGGAIAISAATNIPYEDAVPILQSLSPNRWPAELQGRTSAEIAAVWPGWVSRHDQQIRARLAAGDEDTLINLLLFGATFTARPRVKESDLIGQLAGRHSTDIIAGSLVQGRLDDFVAGLASPGGNERLQFARQVVERQRIDPATAAGRAEARQYLTERLSRVLDEYERYSLTQPASPRADRAATVADQLTLFRDRGLSSDTTILPDFAIDQALRALKSRAGWEGRVRRVAIVGPGLDFADKREGYDFYAPQTLQPFAVIDSLLRLGLAVTNDLRLTTFDVSPRINQHLAAARERARADDAYVLQLPRNLEVRWRPDLVAYWERFGTAIGAAARPARPPPAAGRVQVRAVTKDVLDAIPAGRSYIDIAALVPGLSASQPGRGTLADIGGTNNLQNTTFTIHGGRTSDTRLMIDGVRIGNVAGNGEYQNFSPDQGSTQEATIDYSSGSAEQMTSGVRIDLIPREGGNTYRGTIFAYGVNSWWQGNNLTQELIDRGLPAPNLMKRAYDINPSFGGPLKRNSLWFYSSARFQENQNYIAGLYYNANAGDPTKWLYVADPARQGYFSLAQKSGNTRVTWQAAPKHKLSFFYDNQGRVWDDGRATISPESFVAYRFPKLRVIQSGWSSPLTSRLLIEARYSNRGEAFFNQPPPEGDVYRRLIPVTEQSSGLFYRGKGGDGGASGTFGSTDQNIHSVLTSLSYVTGAHALKVGFTDTFATTAGWSVSNDYNLAYRFNNGIPNQLTMYGTPTTSGSKLLGEIGVYAQDRWTVNRMTLNLGVRYDQFKSGYPVQHLGPAMYQPTRDLTFPETVGNNFKDVTPKLGAAYDLFGNGKTAVKVNLGKYIGAVTGTGNPAGITNTVTRTWTDANGNFFPDCNLLNLQQQDLRGSGSDFCSVVSSLNFGLPTSVTAFNPDTRFGWGHRTFSWEFSTSVQHEIAPRVSMDFGYFRRWYGNFTTNDNRAVETTDYSPFSVTAPLDPRLPNGGGYVVSGNYNVNPDKSGMTDNYTTFSSDYGVQYEHWNGVDLGVNARLRNGIVVQGGLSTGRTSTDSCDLAAKLDNPSQLYCHVDTKFLTQVKLLGTYTLPRGGVRVAATLQSFPGPAISASTIFTNAQVQPSLGRPLSGAAANVTVNIIEPGTLYGDRANQLDLRVSKIFQLGRMRTTANLDLSNALNASPVMQQNNNYAVWLTPQRIMDARMFKLSAQLDF